jgi:hypothetical protein
MWRASCPVMRTMLHRRLIGKCGAERVLFGGEGSSSVPSPVKEIKLETQGLAQEQSTLCAAHVTAIIGYRPALRYPFSGVGLNPLACEADSGPAIAAHFL